jgi:phosphatidylserine/phosphatidylglycerophosphate/cardiolipin synthase-like enzyme
VIDVSTLADGGQAPQDVAAKLATFLSTARSRLDIAIYDFALSPAVSPPVVDAIRGVAARGAKVRIAYHVDRQDRLPVPPPPSTNPEDVEACGVPAKGIGGDRHLMHQKYAIVDGRAVWTGSSNWTDESWSREENVLATVESPDLAAAYSRDFEDLWRTGGIDDTGDFDTAVVSVGGTRVRPWFSPGRGSNMAHRIAKAIGHARERVRVASPVLTAGPILGTLAEVAVGGRLDLAGVFDATQMEEVMGQWRDQPTGTWKIPAWRTLLGHAPFSGKHSTPYRPGSRHDYMHAKIVVADATSFIGSYNLSHAGEDNAENVLEIGDAAIADRLASYIDATRSRYPEKHATGA